MSLMGHDAARTGRREDVADDEVRLEREHDRSEQHATVGVWRMYGVVREREPDRGTRAGP